MYIMIDFKRAATNFLVNVLRYDYDMIFLEGAAHIEHTYLMSRTTFEVAKLSRQYWLY